MKNQLKFKPMLRLLLATGIAGVAASGLAVTQTSSPVWVGTSTAIEGNGGTGSKVTLFSQRMILPLETAGKVTALDIATLTDTNGTWTEGQFGTNGVPAYVEFNNGWMADIANSSAATHSLTLAGGLGGAVSVGDAYRIHKHFTVASMFGANNDTGLQSGLNPLAADNILLFIPQTQQTMIVFYYDDGTFHGWVRSDFSLAANQIIYPEQGVMVRRKSASNLALLLAGPVKTGTTVVPVDVGYNLFGTLKSATNLTLSALNIYTGDPTTGLASGLNPTASDNLLVVQPNGSTKTYFYYKDPSGEGWLDASFNLANSAQINAGTAFFVRRRAPNGPFNWTIPAE